MSFLDVVLDSVADGVFTVDPDLRITYWNKAAWKITGYSPEEAIGRYCHEVFRASLCLEQCPMRRALATGARAGPTDVTILTVDDQEVVLSVSAAALTDLDGTFIGGVESFRDREVHQDDATDAQKHLEVVGLLSGNQAMRRTLGVLPAVARSDAPVLIRGQSGTGKDRFARAVHSLSQRGDGPFVKLSGATITEELRDEELFGRNDRVIPHWFQAAEGGTLFLDEIADLSPAAQARLLHLLQQESFQAGQIHKSPEHHIRLISSTRQELEWEVREGKFREDLYFRLGVIMLELPPLAKRKDDIPLIIEHALERLCERSGFPRRGVTKEAMSMLMAHDYHGNVRELENLVEHAFIVGQTNMLQREDFPSYVQRKSATRKPYTKVAGNEREVLLAVLRKHGFSKTLAAEELRIHRSTLWRRMRRLGLA
ncbi:MAG: sigma 54-interacting transcriptional regulator [Proteobacteria bacterium]|nr:sigma 54-interacting transcriptional regulator [Pseudomonadota bacterium]